MAHKQARNDLDTAQNPPVNSTPIRFNYSSSPVRHVGDLHTVWTRVWRNGEQLLPALLFERIKSTPEMHLLPFQEQLGFLWIIYVRLKSCI